MVRHFTLPPSFISGHKIGEFRNVLDRMQKIGLEGTSFNDLRRCAARKRSRAGVLEAAEMEHRPLTPGARITAICMVVERELRAVMD
jgi:hypothetical protein